MLAGGDISLGSWTVTQQGNMPSSAQPPAQGTANAPQHGAAQQAQQAVMPAGSGDMDLTTYFAMLPNEVVPFRDLISPLPVSLPLMSEAAYFKPVMQCVQCMVCRHSVKPTSAFCNVRTALGEALSNHSHDSKPWL